MMTKFGEEFVGRYGGLRNGDTAPSDDNARTQRRKPSAAGGTSATAPQDERAQRRSSAENRPERTTAIVLKLITASAKAPDVRRSARANATQPIDLSSAMCADVRAGVRWIRVSDV
jgi:hypothetical protein